MTRRRPPGGCGRAAGTGALALALGWAAAPAFAGALDLYYQRSVMAAADARCRLFAPPVRAALTTAQAQARGAALRAGADEAGLARTLKTARERAGATACDSRDLALASQRVRQAFDGYAKLQRMTFAGDVASWQAHRAVGRDAWAWRLSQGAAFGRDRAVLGLAGRGGEQALTVAAGFADGAWPYAARLVLRDAGRTPLPSPIRLKRDTPLANRTPPRAGARILMADSRSLAEVGLLPSGFKQGVRFRFPAVATRALQELDPREAVAVEFLFSGPRGDTVRAAHFEVGDFAAGAAFLDVAAR